MRGWVGICRHISRVLIGILVTQAFAIEHQLLSAKDIFSQNVVQSKLISIQETVHNNKYVF